MPTQIDPRYFNIGNAFLSGQQDAQEQQRRNAMLDLETQQQQMYGQRLGLEQQRYADEQNAMQAQAAQQAQVIEARKKILRDHGLPEEYADDPELGQELDKLVFPQEQKVPASYQEYQMGQQDPGFADYLERQNAPKVPQGTWGQPFEGVGPDGQPAMFQSNSATGEVRPAAVNGQPLGPKPPKKIQHFRPQDYSTARVKLTNIRIARNQLQKVKDAYYGLKDEKSGKVSGGVKGSYSAGPFADKFTFTQGGKLFDAAVDQLRGSINGLTRVPGVGSMSDFETRLDQSKMPSRGEYEASTEQKIEGLDQMLNELERGYTDILGEVEESSGQGAPAQPPSGGRRKYDKNGKPISGG